jgi:hypothetical protein
LIGSGTNNAQDLRNPRDGSTCALSNTRYDGHNHTGSNGWDLRFEGTGGSFEGAVNITGKSSNRGDDRIERRDKTRD